jgi:putative YhdH/YhfP family quinone oxidoreductase
MILGTAGFTAALSLFRMEQNAQSPSMGPIAVTGASGGVGMLAIDILARAGYEVDAITGKADHADFLRRLAPAQSRRASRWTGAAGRWNRRSGRARSDNVGGDTLAGLCRKLQPYGNVASCGMAGGHEVHGTVMPHIIRGVSVLGIASAGTAIGIRRELWRRLGSDWKPAHLDTICTRELGLAEIAGSFPRNAGRSLVRTHAGQNLTAVV